MKHNEAMDAIAALVAGETGIRLALIFGSLAKGRARNDSDVDVAVAADRPLDIGTKMRLIEQLAVLTGRPIDLVDLQAADGLILKQVLVEGRLLFCRDRALYARLMQRMIFDQEDAMRYHQRILAVRRNAWISA
jgi:predicted nucleotidyltransferase